MINDMDISQKDVKGTGQAGKITKNDVLAISKENIVSGERGISRKKMSSLRRRECQNLN